MPTKVVDSSWVAEIKPPPPEIKAGHVLYIKDAIQLTREERLLASLLITVAAQQGAWSAIAVDARPKAAFDRLLRQKGTPWCSIQTMSPLHNLVIKRYLERGVLEANHTRDSALLATWKLAYLAEKAVPVKLPGKFALMFFKWWVSLFTFAIATLFASRFTEMTWWLPFASFAFSLMLIHGIRAGINRRWK